MATGIPQGIYVLAGTNGAGKSSILGKEIALVGSRFLNPDVMAQRLIADKPDLTLDVANSQAWHEMVRLLERAIEEQLDFAFETTLGGSTIVGHLLRACALNIDVRVAYVGLISADLHVERVRQRVLAGGHPVPEDTIRARYDSSRENLVQLLPSLRELWLYDNSEEYSGSSSLPEPMGILHMENGRIASCCDAEDVPNWAKPVVAAALAANG